MLRNELLIETAKNYFFKGIECLKKKDFYQAEIQFNESLKLIPNKEQTLVNLSVALLKQNKFFEAEKAVKKLLKINVNNIQGWLNLGNIYLENQRIEEAIDSYKKAIKIKPDYGEAWFNIANAYSRLSQFEESNVSYDEAIRYIPGNSEIWFNKGNLLLKKRKYEEALNAYQNAVKYQPNFYEAWLNAGIVHLENKNYELALSLIDEALKINNEFSKAWVNKSKILSVSLNYGEAINSIKKALEIDSNSTEAWFTHGNILKETGDILGAEICYRKAVELDEKNLEAHSNLLFIMNYMHSKNNQEKYIEAKSYGNKLSRYAVPKYVTWKQVNKDEKLKIGFVSGDIRKHPVGYFIEGLIQELDKTKYEIYLYDTSNLEDELTNRIKPFIEKYISINTSTDKQAAEIIYSDKINILIDLSGHTAHNRLGVFSYKPAEVQITWLGYFATTGLPEMDYFLGDIHMCRESDAQFFTEKLWKLDPTWLCLKPPMDIKKDENLPFIRNQYITFGNLSNLTKINDTVMQAWAAILKNVPKSKLLIKTRQLDNLEIQNKIKKKFHEMGIENSRIILEKSESREEYFKKYTSIDIILDTFPYPGGTTSIDSLWMGVPVLTMKGDSFLSRLGESIAINSGNQELIAENIQDYINKAIKIASDIERLNDQRKQLIEKMIFSPLFDTKRFAKSFDTALQEMWNNKLSDRNN